jgi:hypothetical protein
MTDLHPITPPPELLQQWATEYWGNPGESIGCGEKYIATQAARWGADQELEACVDWLIENQNPRWAHVLRTARRLKPPSLKEQALEVVTGLEKRWDLQCDLALIRRALEALPND